MRHVSPACSCAEPKFRRIQRSFLRSEVVLGGEREREREREREKERETDRERDRETERERQREKEREKERETDREKERESERDRDRESIEVQSRAFLQQFRTSQSQGHEAVVREVRIENDRFENLPVRTCPISEGLVRCEFVR